MLTNLNDAYHTMIDPFTEAIQIYGRFRDKYHRGQLPFNSLTHITNVKPTMKVQSNTEVDTMVQAWKQVYAGIYIQWQNETNPTAKQTLENDLQKVGYADLLDESGNFNHFSLDNLHNAERVNRYYAGSDKLIRVYQLNRHFIVNHNVKNHLFVSSFQSGIKTASQKREQIVLELEKLVQHKNSVPAFDIESYKDVWRLEEITYRESGDLIVDAYDYLGKTVIESIGYSRPVLLKKATAKAKAKVIEMQSFTVILVEIKRQYAINQTESKNDIKNFLQEVYQLNGIDTDVTHDTIKKYCTVTSNNSKNPPTYTIRAYK
jgi:hypothetical protein